MPQKQAHKTNLETSWENTSSGKKLSVQKKWKSVNTDIKWEAPRTDLNNFFLMDMEKIGEFNC